METKLALLEAYGPGEPLFGVGPATTRDVAGALYGFITGRPGKRPQRLGLMGTTAGVVAALVGFFGVGLVVGIMSVDLFLISHEVDVFLVHSPGTRTSVSSEHPNYITLDTPVWKATQITADKYSA